MMRSAVAIAGIVGLAAISYRLIRHFLASSESHIDKPRSKDKKQDRDYSGPEPRMHNREAFPCNSNAFDALEWRKPILNSVVEALSDPNTHLIGVYGSHDEIKDTLLQRVRRRVQRDQLFDMVVTAAVTKYPDMRKIQEDIASQLGLTFIHVSKDKRAIELMHRVKNEQKILVVLCNLHKGLDLGKLGIPYGADHTGCKILLSSTSEDVLSNRMHTHVKSFSLLLLRVS